MKNRQISILTSLENISIAGSILLHLLLAHTFPSHPSAPLPPPLTPPLPPSGPALALPLSPCLNVFHSFQLTSSPSSFCVFLSASPCLSFSPGLCVWRNLLTGSPPSSSIPAPFLLLPSLPSVPPTPGRLGPLLP